LSSQLAAIAVVAGATASASQRQQRVELAARQLASLP